MVVMVNTTTIEISVENWQWLNSLKRPGESFDDVLTRLRSDSPQNPTGNAHDDLSDHETLPEGLDLPGSGDILTQRRATIALLYKHLQRQGTATKSDFLELVDPNTVGYSSAESFWSNCIKGRDSLAALPHVEPPAEGEHTWRYTKQNARGRSGER